MRWGERLFRVALTQVVKNKEHPTKTSSVFGFLIIRLADRVPKMLGPSQDRVLISISPLFENNRERSQCVEVGLGKRGRLVLFSVSDAPSAEE